ncbi:MAG TPA: tail fiber domain-containing protein, partial [Rhodothermales bacterium]
ADAVGSSEIATDAVGSDEIATGAVGSDEIADGSVTAADLAPSSINGSSIVDGSIGAAKLAANSVVTDLAGLRGSISVTGGGTITVQTIPGMNELRISSVGPSSIRWKKDVETLDNALAIVEQLRGVRYTWKETGKEDIGFIAEEVGQVLPEIVAWEENGVDAQGVDYARVVSVLVEAVKEQQREIDAQQQTLAQLAERLAKLEGQMNQASADASIR